MLLEGPQFLTDSTSCFPNFPAGFPEERPFQGILQGPKSWHHTLNPNPGPSRHVLVEKMCFPQKWVPQLFTRAPQGAQGSKFGPQFNY